MGGSFGDVLVDARDAYAPGQRVVVVFAAAHPGNDLHRGDTFLRVERADGDGWVTVQDDGDWATRFLWTRRDGGASEATVRWDIPEGTAAGSYRLTYVGDARDPGGAVRPFSGQSATFEVRAPA